jgi:hypothetical protein
MISKSILKKREELRQECLKQKEFSQVSDGGINYHLANKTYEGITFFNSQFNTITHDVNIIILRNRYEAHVDYVEPRDKEKIIKRKTIKGIVSAVKKLNA